MRSPSRQARRAGVRSRLVALVGSVLLLAGLVPAATVVPVLASHTTAPTSVTIAGSLQSELGCPGDWQPECAATHLLRRGRQVWQGTFAVPSAATPYEYKAALNDAWTENYGANAAFNGGNIGLTVGDANATKFYYSHDSHWVTSNRNAAIADGRRQLPERDRLPGRLAARLPPVLAPGPGRQRRLHLRQRRDPGRRLRDQGRRSTRPGTSPIPPRTSPFTRRRGRGRHDHLHGLDERRHGRQRAAPAARHDGRPRRQPPGELGCPGDWQPECAATELTLGDRRRLARRLHRARRQLGVQGRPERHVGRQLRRGRRPQRREHRADPGRRDRGPVLLRRHDPLGHEQPQRDDRHGAPAASRARSAARATGRPTASARGSRTSTANGVYTFVTDDIPAGDYEFKVALDEAWDTSYPGRRRARSPSRRGDTVTFTYTASTNAVTVDVRATTPPDPGGRGARPALACATT